MVLCLSLLAVPAGAYSRVETGAPASLELNYVDSERNVALTGMELRLYKVAEMSDAARFTVTDDFRPAGVFTPEFSWEKLGDQDWVALAGTLSAYVVANRAAGGAAVLRPAAEGAVDTQGKLTFSGLSVGLYLVEGSRLVMGDYTYTPNSFLVALPSLDVEQNDWLYDVKAANKYSRSQNVTPPVEEGDTISRNAMKRWADTGYEESRPSSVQVQLLRDDEVYDTATLNEENRWRYSWTQLSPDYTWRLVELDIPADYTVLVEQQGNTFVVTNTFTTDITDEAPPLGDGDGIAPDVPGENVPGETVPEEELLPEEVPLGNLPQTGILWWPVQLLMLAGILLCGIGCFEYRRGKRS